MSKKEDLTFEQALTQLENVVTQLEKDDVPLDKLIEYYQRGMELVKLSNNKLKNAEEKMAKVLDDNDKLAPFHMEEE